MYSYKSTGDANPKGYYHRKCHSAYTHKGHLERFKAKRTKSESGAEADAAAKPVESNPPKKPHLSRIKYGITSFDKCIICQREKTQKKGTKPLSNYETFQAGRTLPNAAKVRQDERIIVAIEWEDVVAIEVNYHRSCYKNYIWKKTVGQIAKKTQKKIAVYTT